MVPFVGVPQWVWAQTPGAFSLNFMSALPTDSRPGYERMGYRSAQRNAQAIVDLSEFMRTAMRQRGSPPHHGATIYVGVDDEVFVAAGAPLGFASPAAQDRHSFGDDAA